MDDSKVYEKLAIEELEDSFNSAFKALKMVEASIAFGLNPKFFSMELESSIQDLFNICEDLRNLLVDPGEDLVEEPEETLEED